MLRVGLTGGLASGKSLIGREWERAGGFVLRSDEMGHQVMARAGAAYELVVREFGAEVLASNGEIDRGKLGSLVFGQPERLRVLEGIVHPAVFEEQERRLTAYFSQKPEGVGVVEAAILIEAGGWRRCDRIVVASCTEEQQVARARARDGMSEEQARQRMARQLTLLEKLRYADYVIDTSKTVEETRAQAMGLWSHLVRESQARVEVGS